MTHPGSDTTKLVLQTRTFGSFQGLQFACCSVSLAAFAVRFVYPGCQEPTCHKEDGGRDQGCHSPPKLPEDEAREEHHCKCNSSSAGGEVAHEGRVVVRIWELLLDFALPRHFHEIDADPIRDHLQSAAPFRFASSNALQQHDSTKSACCNAEVTFNADISAMWDRAGIECHFQWAVSGGSNGEELGPVRSPEQRQRGVFRVF